MCHLAVALENDGDKAFFMAFEDHKDDDDADKEEIQNCLEV